MDAGVAETHTATVFFNGDRAYKLKKPVDLGFLDFSTRAARETACRREVELNRRLAPDVYLGVADVRGVDGELCDHLVVMRRMPANRRLSTLLAEKAPVNSALRQIAQRLASLHTGQASSVAAKEAASLESIQRRWGQNTDALIDLAPRYFDDSTVAAVHGLACRYLDGRVALFAARVREGRAVDGHGDLLCDDIFILDDGPRILDCLEFDDDLRLGDGLADAAFLAMDLEHQGRPELAHTFLNIYRNDVGDAWPVSLAHHYIAHRAQTRAKVTAIRASQGHPELASEAARLLDQSLRHLEAGSVRLVLVGGLPGTGKSTLAKHLAIRTGAVVLRADAVRKELAGVSGPAADPFEEGIYSAAHTARAYSELLRRAEIALGMGESVVVDASFTDSHWRDSARQLAHRMFAETVELRCDAPAQVANERMVAREAAQGDPSDATPAIAAAMREVAHEWPEAATICTDGSRDDSLRAALAHVAARVWAPQPVRC